MRAPSLRIRTVFAASVLLLVSACADFSAMLAMPSSRGMTRGTLDQQVQVGMNGQDVLARIGRPAYSFPVGRQGVDVWNYRFAPPEGDCFVYQISISQSSGRVTEIGQGYDRYCDGPDARS